jgi:hypothetical protein
MAIYCAKYDQSDKRQFSYRWIDFFNLIGYSEDGAALLDALQFKSASPLSRLLQDLSKGKPFLNPSFTHDELRLIFSKIPVLFAYFHEFQGMRVAENRLLALEINLEEFREIILGFYGHNGPGDPHFEIAGERPFWSHLPKLILSRIEALVSEETLPASAHLLFKATQFEQEDGSLKYHDPQTALGIEHALYDRFDGYRDSTKIREELSFMPPIQAEVESLIGPNYNTKIAILYTKRVLLPRMRTAGQITGSEHARLIRVCDKLIERVDYIFAQICSRIENAADLRKALKDARPLDAITLRLAVDLPGTVITRTFTREELGSWDSDAASSFRRFIDTHIRTGVAELDRHAHGIYEDFYGVASFEEV